MLEFSSIVCACAREELQKQCEKLATYARQMLQYVMLYMVYLVLSFIFYHTILSIGAQGQKRRMEAPPPLLLPPVAALPH